MPEIDVRRYRLSDVLTAELTALKGQGEGDDRKITVADRYGALTTLSEVVAAAGPGDDAAGETERRRVVYFWAHQLRLAALCLSGGGIRSASFALGVIQALAEHKFLQKFDYLSTVSGGGYIGSWLSAWLRRSGDPAEVLRALHPRRDDTDHEPPEIEHLREYSNYLTPRLGIFSADTWTAVAIILRNLVVNWLILVPALALPAAVAKLLTAGLQSEAHGWEGFVALVCLLLGCLALGYKLLRLYAPEPKANAAQAERRFLMFSLTPALAGGLCFAWLVEHHSGTPADAILASLPSWEWLQPTFAWIKALPSWPRMVAFSFAVYLGALAFALFRSTPLSRGVTVLGANRPFAIAWKDFLAWGGGVIIFATIIWLGVQLFGWVAGDRVEMIPELCVKTVKACVADPHPQPISVSLKGNALLVIFAMPWFLLSTILGHTGYLLLRNASPSGDVEREWLGRASGWHFIAGLGWLILFAVVLLGPELYYNARLLGENAPAWLASLTAASGTITALIGKSGATPAKGAATGWTAIGSNLILAVVGPLFVVLLLILLSVVIDWSLLGQHTSMYYACLAPSGVVPTPEHCGTIYWATPILALVAVMAAADGFANVNRFSLHALYRNRLVRAFLGGSRARLRNPDQFTGFDWGDDLRVASLWKPPPAEGQWRPLHILNMTLNLTSSKNLAWQQRKAMSFTVGPQFCGSADLGYRATESYADPLARPIAPGADTGISLGTAMAISGAAVSPNMGYHSSTSISLLLTLFNVRLGWWLGNPGVAGARPSRLGTVFGASAPFLRDGPYFALRPMLAELFGLTNQDSPYVYLSDGGHFEDLGLYEMVRRRCRCIIVCDGAQDADRAFEDLGNAVRKIWIDLGVRIRFTESPLLKADKETKPHEVPYYALGTIEYVSDKAPDGSMPTGRILYIKPVVRGDEDAGDVIAYQRLKPEFPQQSTGDQWFDEPQIEAYRALGYLTVCRIIDAAKRTGAMTDDLDELFDRLDKINPATMGPKEETERT